MKNTLLLFAIPLTLFACAKDSGILVNTPATANYECRLDSISENSYLTIFKYNSSNLIETIKFYSDTNFLGFTNTYTYDTKNRLVGLKTVSIYSGQKEKVFSYDTNNRLTKIVDGGFSSNFNYPKNDEVIRTNVITNYLNEKDTSSIFKYSYYSDTVFIKRIDFEQNVIEKRFYKNRISPLGNNYFFIGDGLLNYTYLNNNILYKELGVYKEYYEYEYDLRNNLINISYSTVNLDIYSPKIILKFYWDKTCS